MPQLFLFIIVLCFSCHTEALSTDPTSHVWQLGNFNIHIENQCDIVVKRNHQTLKIKNHFDSAQACNVAMLVDTNIPNAFVVGGGYILLIEQVLSKRTDNDFPDRLVCDRRTRALVLLNSGKATLSDNEIKSGNCDGQIEAHGAMYLANPHRELD
ncbi:hypothetical protein [Flocculibacter collagenilyticus]|uniref:hypothetical protein n=1 Tax=Flocculibacter collagenilyticus TaxID=2744479 RepID=UPI0018F35695|nr:hypothetical protein [Flocculibacter collagenilyticus]